VGREDELRAVRAEVLVRLQQAEAAADMQQMILLAGEGAGASTTCARLARSSATSPLRPRACWLWLPVAQLPRSPGVTGGERRA
jgi:hypothetical protein